MDQPEDAAALSRRIIDYVSQHGRVIVHHVMQSIESDTSLSQSQVSALRMLHHRQMTISELAQARNVSLQAASSFVQGLVEKGWVERIEDPNDRRRSLLAVTPAAIAEAENHRQQMIDSYAQVLQALTPDERAAAHRFLDGLERIATEFSLFSTDTDESTHEGKSSP